MADYLPLKPSFAERRASPVLSTAEESCSQEKAGNAAHLYPWSVGISESLDECVLTTDL